MTFSLRTIISSAAVSILFLVALDAHAAGTVTIIQQSPIGIYGDYTLTSPLGSQITIHEQERRELASAEIGTYLLHLSPPADARMTTTVRKNGIDLIATADRDVSFTLANADTVTVTIQYRYDGTVVVDSDPRGISFELLGPGNFRATGVSPVTSTGVAPGAYRVTFRKREGCDPVSPIQRSLKDNGSLTLMGKFTCDAESPPASLPSEAEEPAADLNEERAVRIWVVAQQAEVLAGGGARTTITVKNIGNRTVHDLVISAQIDPTVMKFLEPLPRFNTVDGGTATWEVPQLYAGNTWSVTLPIAMSASMKQGEQATVTARVSASDLANGNAGIALVAATTIGVTGLPVTGLRFDILFLILSTVFTAFCAKKTVQLALQRS